MRLMRYQTGSGVFTGIQDVNGDARGFGSEVALPSLDDMFQRDGEPDLSVFDGLATAPVLEPGTFSYRAPLEKPQKIICVGLNYADHTAESPYDQPDYPTIFPRFASSLVGHQAAMIRPNVSDSFDFEGEMVAVIGKPGRHISRQDALDHVFGYSVFNDGSVREYQFKSPQWTVGKNFDGTGAFGPTLVTADELPTGGEGLQLTTRLNGQVVQSANTSDMLFKLPELIAVLSEAVTLHAGDIIVTGTPSGIGWAREPKLLMQHGDTVEVEIEGIGKLTNPIVQEA